MALSFTDFMRVQVFARIPQPTESFSSKTVVVVGANTGIGKESVKHLVRLGSSKIILGCRDTSKGESAKAEIQSLFPTSKSILEVWEVDLISYPSVQEFARRVSSQLERLDTLILNAGLNLTVFQVCNGTEMSMGVNVLSTFLLAMLLVPKLRETARRFGVSPNLTFTTSAMYTVAKFPERQDDVFDWLGKRENVDPHSQYALTKLFHIVVIRKLATLIDPQTDVKTPTTPPIIVNSLDPCLCKTDLFRSVQGPLKIVLAIFKLFARTAEEGARLVVIAASADRESHGGYMRVGALKEYAPNIMSPSGVENSEYVWDQVAKKLEGIQPGLIAAATETS
ncbi:hypothetical protein BJ875DRAFT_428651 [Amylocarpus encephaloides]|uniref:Uncharacterized protein n=1 Tax=Amylocarpus encephaloides TaxID=45428 RepID=A0A9P8C2X6_9HELO|nr:hypothetical protein BJ875DRAFT_428651 [Amylocarpus encephaloides]